MRAKEINTDNRNQEIPQSIPGFPLACYLSEFSSETYHYIDWHWHVEFQLCLVTKGSVLWRVGPQQFTAACGEGIFINSQQVHKAAPYLCEDASFFCVDFRPDLICADKTSSVYIEQVYPVLNDTGLCAKKLLAEWGHDSSVLEYLKQMALTFVEQPPGYEFELVGRLYLLWKELFPILHQHAESGSSPQNSRLKEIMIFLQQNYARNLSLNEIAKSAALSRSECCRYFKKLTGQTIFEYLLQYRIHKSLELLKETDMDIARIALECGFSSQSYYASCFKRLIGCTPKTYRKTKQD